MNINEQDGSDVYHSEESFDLKSNISPTAFQKMQSLTDVERDDPSFIDEDDRDQNIAMMTKESSKS
jgi:hypothetical protein